MVIYSFFPLPPFLCPNPSLPSFSDGACCSVIAATPLQYHVIDGEMMNILFISFPELHTRFYRYLGFVCAERTSKEMLCEDEVFISHFFPSLFLLDTLNQFLTMKPKIGGQNDRKCC